jgi:hypothetical protein
LNFLPFEPKSLARSELSSERALGSYGDDLSPQAYLREQKFQEMYSTFLKRGARG